MPKSRRNKGCIVAMMIAEKHEKYGFTSLETLSAWNNKIDKNKDSKFECRKESQCIGVGTVEKKKR